MFPRVPPPVRFPGKGSRGRLLSTAVLWVIILLVAIPLLAVRAATASVTATDSAAVDRAIAAAQKALLIRQNTDGFWSGTAQMNTAEFPDSLGVTASYLAVMQQLGVENASTRRALNYLLTAQRADGSYGDINADFTAQLVLEQAGLPSETPALQHLRRHLAESGKTLDQALPYVQMYWARAGRISWDQVYYGQVADDYAVDRPPDRLPLVYYRDQLTSMSILKTLHQSKPLTSGQKQSIKMTEWFLIRRQLPDGSWFSMSGATAEVLSALSDLGYPVNHPTMVQALKFLDTMQRDDGSMALFKVPTWDTAIALLALKESGLGPDQPEVRRATQWLIDHRFPTGAWGFTAAASVFPDYDDTGLALAAVGPYTPIFARDPISFTLAHQYEDGGWGTFYQGEGDPKGPLALSWVPVNKETGVWWDPSVPDITAHVLMGLARNGYTVQRPEVAKIVNYFRSVQFANGMWYAYWGIPYIYGTSNVLMALSAAGEDMQAPYVRQAVEWLRSQQNDDGGWGESRAAMLEGPWRAGRGASTATQTAWALLGLLSAGEPVGSPAITRGMQYLLSRQRPDGTWPPERTMFATSEVFYWLEHDNIDYELWALSKYRSAATPADRKLPVLGAGLVIVLLIGSTLASRYLPKRSKGIEAVS